MSPSRWAKIEIYPTVQPETLRAQPPAGGGAAGAAPSAPAISGGDSDEAVSIIAEKQSGPEIQAAVGKAQGEVAARRQEHTEAVAEERAKNQEQITAARIGKRRRAVGGAGEGQR